MEILKFEEMNLSDFTMKALQDMGFSEATPIQSEAIPKVMSGRDIIGQAQTGTGKTAAFGIPIVEKVDGKSRETQALVLCPTRELAVQDAGEIQKLAKHKHGVEVQPIYGGQNIDRQIRSLQQGVQVVIGTPGRILDHIHRGTLGLSSVTTCVLDEADEMLDMGFYEDIMAILSCIMNEKRQMLLFSATMPPEIQRLAEKFLRNPEVVRVVHQEMTVPKVAQEYYEMSRTEKPEALCRLVDYYNPKLTMVFCNTKVAVEELKEKIHAAGFLVEALHGDMKQTQREFVMKRFRRCDFDILIATDVAARGLDVDDVDLVVNYDLPQDDEYYVHRIGRTARAGREGRAVTFVTMKEFRKIRDIEHYVKVKIERKKLPSLADVEDMRNNAFMEDLLQVVEEGGLDRYLTLIAEKLAEQDPIEVAAALMKMILDRKNSDIGSGGAPADDEWVRFFVTIGRRDNVTSRQLVDFIYDTTGISGRNIEGVTMLEKFSFVNIPGNMANDFVGLMSAARFQGKKVNVELANKK
jgi:ATP-dependent RNA helicase DeaD